MKKVKIPLNIIWLIFFALFLFLMLVSFYVSFSGIKVYKDSPYFSSIGLGHEPLLKPILDFVDAYNSFSSFTNLISAFGFLAAALTAAYSYYLENERSFGKKFYSVLFLVFLIFVIFLFIFPQRDLSPCFGCVNLYFPLTPLKCINNSCVIFNDGNEIFVKRACQNDSIIFGRIDWDGNYEIYDDFKIKDRADCNSFFWSNYSLGI
jgi:hypothetical protein